MFCKPNLKDIMKKSYMLFVILLTCLINQSFADSQSLISLKSVLVSANKEMIAGRIRVRPEEVVLNQNGVFINLAGRLLVVESLASDVSGLYCYFDFNEDDDDDYLWECTYCHTLNKMSRKKCKKCGTWQ